MKDRNRLAIGISPGLFMKLCKTEFELINIAGLAFISLENVLKAAGANNSEKGEVSFVRLSYERRTLKYWLFRFFSAELYIKFFKASFRLAVARSMSNGID